MKETDSGSEVCQGPYKSHESSRVTGNKLSSSKAKDTEDLIPPFYLEMLFGIRVIRFLPLNRINSDSDECSLLRNTLYSVR